MKVCPICKARCFDDMERCFGCMHLFNAEGYAGLNVDSADATEWIQGSDQEKGSPIQFVQGEVAIPLFDKSFAGEVNGAELILPVIDRQERGRPKHAAGNALSLDGRGPSTTDQDTVSAAPKSSGFTAHYQLVISLEPVAVEEGSAHREHGVEERMPTGVL